MSKISNEAKSLEQTNKVTSGRLALYFKSTRSAEKSDGLNIPHLYQCLQIAAKECIVDTIILAFYIRDCRGGKGERDLGRRCFQWLFLNYSSYFMKVVNFIPEYGRWDDLLYLWPKVLQLQAPYVTPSNVQRKEWIDFLNRNYYSNIKDWEELNQLQNTQEDVVRVMGNQLVTDQQRMMKNEKDLSLCAKWAPTERDALDQRYEVVETLCKTMSWQASKYRKEFTSPIRDYLRTTETLMCRGDWDNIDFNKVPSCAMKRLKKAFAKNSCYKFSEWCSRLETGGSKVNARQLFPYEIVSDIGENSCADPVRQAQWDSLLKKTKEIGCLKDSLVVIDSSASMLSWPKKIKKYSFTPLDVAIGLGMLITSCTEGTYNRRPITFSQSPTFVTLKGSVEGQYMSIRGSQWAGSTNLQATFDLVLQRAKKFKVPHDLLPKKIFILSDMHFDAADVVVEQGIKKERTNFESIDAQYRASGYIRPQIIFWDICGQGKDFAVSAGTHGATLVSGFSLDILKAVIDGGNLNSWEIVQETINNQRYTQVRDALSI